MKTKIMMSVMLLMAFSLVGMAQTKTETFKVYGNCGMCKTRIDDAAKSVEGITTADWNKETKMLEITFDSTKTNAHKVMMAVSKVGHDTDMTKAADDVYNKLPGCCKYERPESKSDMPKQHNK